METPPDRLSLGRLKWLAIGVPVVAIGLLELVVHLLYPALGTWPGRVVLAGAVVTGLVFFFGAVFEVLGRMQERLRRQNRELLALHRAAIDIYGELSLDVVLQKIVDQVRQLLGARYGALSVIDDEGAIREFVTSGIDPETRASIGDPPRGRGLFGVVLGEKVHLRLDEVSSDGRFSGFPEGHPEMHSLLAVPILCRSPFRGNIYVADRESGVCFSDGDEEALVRFATVSAIAIDNAYLHEQVGNIAVVEERARLAREMHDSLAQVLAYVNTKAQAVEKLLHRQRFDEASRQIEQLSAATRDVYLDVREGILALRSQPSRGRTLEGSLRDFLDSWQEQCGVAASLDMTSELEVSPAVELQLMRIIQEALANVRKHAAASRVEVALIRQDGALGVRVSDDGCGFDLAGRASDSAPRDPGGRPRFGLAIMRERAEAIGGTLSVDSTPGQGTEIRVVVPE